MRARLTAAATALTLACAGLAGAFAASAPARAAAPPPNPLLVEETFTDASIADGRWISGYGKPGTGFACLTAAKGATGPLKACPGGPRDKPGHGTLRITDKTGHQGGFAFFDRPFSTAEGLEATFDSFQYDTTTARGADGISFFLIDGSAHPTREGMYGGALGYKGLVGGYIGIGLDQFGNFSNPAWAGKGGPGMVRNAVALRGATSIGSPYITGTKSLPQSLSLGAAKTRGPAQRSVRVRLSTAMMLTLEMDYHDGKGYRRLLGPVNLRKIPGQPALPPTFKLGFAASTGASTAYHEVRRVRVEGLPPDLYVTPRTEGDFTAGGTGKLELTVHNKPLAGPSDQPVTLRTTLPPGLVPTGATGGGWTCKVDGSRVTCARPGTGPDSLEPGASYPPVVIPVQAAPDAVGKLPLVSAVTTPDDADHGNDKADYAVKVASRTGLWVKEDVAPDPYVAGEKLTYTVTAGNDGPGRARGARLTAQLPAPLSEVRWSCVPMGGATCPKVPGGDLDTEIDLPVGAKLAFAATGTVAPSSGGPLKGTARIVPPRDAEDANCLKECTAEASADGSVHTALSVRHEHLPKVLEPGGKVTYTIVVRNEGPSDAVGSQIVQQAPDALSDLPWTCAAKAPSRCGDATGRGPVDTTADIAAGDEVTYTMVGLLPRDPLVSEVHVDPPVLAEDPRCANGCSARDEALLP
ncbi:lectin-like domain-containing protein [Streptomyces sp. NBC_01465]|uniref:lectin-like domain-containing protein n=1 Tax=Streptomyces sp. NBC_01465 TaxID=2903878 RepID=UPI002E328A75|nr:hypothetical protein [Streptomyces sp. NBC_01465]